MVKARPKQSREAETFGPQKQQQEARQGEQDHEMRGVGVGAVDSQAERQHRVARGGKCCGSRVEEAPPQQEYQEDAGQVRQQQAEVNPRDALAENGDEEGVHDADAGELHGVGMGEG